MRSSALLLAGLLAGCATAGASDRATPALPAAYSATAAATVPADWWRARLADPALAQLIDAGLRDAPDLAAAAARVEQARAQLRGTGADRLPEIGASASVTRSRSSPAEFGFGGSTSAPGAPTIDRNRTIYRAGLDASWDFDLFGRLRASERAAQARLDAATADAQAVRLALVTDIARNYVAARAAAARAAVARENLTASNDLLSITRARAKAGLVAGIDAVRAETLAAEAASTVAPLEAERAARVAALTTLTALPPARIAPLVADGALPNFGPLPAAGLPGDLLRRRPDLAAAERRLNAADADTAAAVAARLPSLSITGAVGLVATALGDLFSDDALSASAGAGLAGPLLDFGRNRARVAESRARASEALADYRRTALQAFGDVETNLAAATARAAQVRELERLVATSQDAASLALIQYRRGIADFLGVLDAQRTLNRNRDTLLAAKQAQLDAELALFRAIGGDYPAAPER